MVSKPINIRWIRTCTEKSCTASDYRQFTLNIKMKNYMIKTSFVSPEGPKARAKHEFFSIWLFVIRCDK